MNKELLINPLWRGEDFGKSIPKSPHAVSVALPRWKDVIAYEEQDAECIKSLNAPTPGRISLSVFSKSNF